MTERAAPRRGHHLIRGGAVVSMDPEIGTLPRADVRVEDGRIVAVGDGQRAPRAAANDATTMIVMPRRGDSIMTCGPHRAVGAAASR